MANQVQKVAAAKKALLFWHNRALQYNYKLSFDQLISWMNKSNAVFLENFGDSALLLADYRGWDSVQESMEALADDSQGRLPQYTDGFFKAYDFMNVLTQRVDTRSWGDVWQDAKTVADQTVEAAKTVAFAGIAGFAAWQLWTGAVLAATLYLAMKKKA